MSQRKLVQNPAERGVIPHHSFLGTIAHLLELLLVAGDEGDGGAVGSGALDAASGSGSVGHADSAAVEEAAGGAREAEGEVGQGARRGERGQAPEPAACRHRGAGRELLRRSELRPSPAVSRVAGITL